MEFTVDDDGSVDLGYEATFGPELSELIMKDPDWIGAVAMANEEAERLE